MVSKEYILLTFLNAWNNKDLDTCMSLVAQDIELRSTYAQHLFPESKGILQGKQFIKAYLELIFKGISNVKVVDPAIHNAGDYYVVHAYNNDQSLNYYIHYYINEDNLIYLVKSNMTQPL